MKLMLDPALPDHPKMWALADETGLNDNEALGVIVRLWCKAMQTNESGLLERWTDKRLGETLKVVERTKECIDALVKIGFLEPLGEGEGWKIHDWEEHQGPLIERRAYDRERMREKRRAAAMMRGNENGKPEGPPADQGSSLAARCAATYRKTCPIINQQSATNLIQFALDAGANPQAVEKAFYDSAGVKGKKVWEILKSLTPEEKKSRDWTDAMEEMIHGKGKA